MLSMQIGWEVDNINGGGANFVVPLQRSITVLGYQFDMSLGFPVVGSSGFSEVLCFGAIATGDPTTKFVGLAQSFNGPVARNNDIGTSIFVNPNKYAGRAGAGKWSGALFSAMMKTNAPAAGSRIVAVSNLSLIAPAGSFLLFHMDHFGVSGDVEMQGVIFYE